MRAFLAFDLDEAFVEGAVAATKDMRERLRAKPRWCTPETMHVTARFFGQVSDLAPIVALVPRLLRPAPHVRVSRVDGFPDLRRARVLVLAIEDDGTIPAIADEAEKAAVALGYPPEERAYRPHLTLARFKEPADLRDLGTPIALEGRAIALTLYESKTTQAGPVYTPIARSLLE